MEELEPEDNEAIRGNLKQVANDYETPSAEGLNCGPTLEHTQPVIIMEEKASTTLHSHGPSDVIPSEFTC